MKKSLNFLPAEKRRDLRQLVAIVRDEVKDCVMVILYGSYARGTYTDYDQREEYGIRNCFMSDYDILIVTKRRLGENEQKIYSRIKSRFFENKNFELQTKPQFINDSIARLNKNLELGQYFYTDIKKDGVVLYDSKEYTLARRRKLDFAEIMKIATNYFDEKFKYANRFLKLAIYNYNDEEDPVLKYRMTAFLLHQATENYLRTIPLVHILYGYKDHDLEIFMGNCKVHTLELGKVFPRDTEEEERLFKLLQESYVQARYNKDFVVTKEDIDALIPKIEHLRDITEKVCKDRLAYYAEMAAKEKK